MVLTDDEKNVPKISFNEVTNVSQLVIGIDSWIAPYFSKQILTTINEIHGLNYKIITRPSSTLIELLDYKAIDIAIFYNENLHLQLELTPPIEDEMILLYNDRYEIRSDFNNFTILKDKPILLFDNPILVYHSTFTSQVIDEFGIEGFQIVDDINVMINSIITDSAYTIVPKSSVFQFLSLFNEKVMPINYILMDRKLWNIKIQIGYHLDTNKLPGLDKTFRPIPLRRLC